ncbi:hypothetical protein [Sediminibacillus massiliensis]|uniref:hypothetical protein n=1 Tax=Sediminibacillus massiliensis TaxID=1926277 RepID=UPI0009885C1F|nr:hypothetical protein [Sediminibacillus massiliensis]
MKKQLISFSLLSIIVIISITGIHTYQTANGDSVSATTFLNVSAKEITKKDMPISSEAGQERGDQDEPSKTQVLSLTESFMDLLVQDTDKYYKVYDYHSKQALIKAFESITTTEIADRYVQYYYEEKDGELYIIPTETPPWFQSDSEYEMISDEEDGKVTIIQDNYSDMYGQYTLELELTYSQRWKITKIDITSNP